MFPRPFQIISFFLLLLLGPNLATVRAEEAVSVAWKSWSQETFDEAKASEKLILLDVSAAWCHWCHVMEETTYRDPAIVSLIEKYFIPIKVDVDARPDIAARYGSIGWPATAFFSPDANPLREVGAYVDPQAFGKILNELLKNRSGSPKTIETSAAKKSLSISSSRNSLSLREGEGRGEGAIETMNTWAEKELLSYYDTKLGGWGKRQKAPVADAVEHAFWKYYLTRDAVSAKRAFSSLLSQRPLLDPVWGGMYQYSDGGVWGRPHFEKIMTVQAGALSNYAQAYWSSGDKRFLSLTRMMLSYLDNFLSSPDGYFFTSQDADLKSLDGNDYFCLSDQERRAWGLPSVDRNVYARENGLAISAFCEAFAATEDEAIRQKALTAANHILSTHGKPGGGFFHAAGPADKTLYLADNAVFGKALLDCFAISGQARYLYKAVETGDVMLQEFASPDGFGLYAHSVDPKAVGFFADRQKPFEENALAARFLLRLHGYTGKAKYRDAAKNILMYLSDEARLKDQGRFLGNYLLATEEFLHEPLHLLVIGAKTDARAIALHESAWKYYAPYKILDWQDPKENPDIAKNYPIFNHPVLFICSTGRCSPPIQNPKNVSKAISDFKNAEIQRHNPI